MLYSAIEEDDSMSESASFEKLFRYSCPECGSLIIHDTSCGEYICKSCGYVVMEKMDYWGHENHSNNPQNRLKNMRGSGRTSWLFANMGLQTEISNIDRDYSGRPISVATAERIASVRRLHSRLKVSSEERRVSRVLAEINRICSKMSLPESLSEAAAKIYRNYASKKNTKGLSIRGNAASAVYLACKQSGVARGLEDVIGTLELCGCKSLSLKTAFRCYKKMVMCLTDEETFGGTMRYHYDPIGKLLPIEKYISKVASTAHLDWRVQRLAVDIARQTRDNILLSGKDPMGVAAAYLYISACLCGYNVYLTEIAGLSSVTEITIRMRCRDILTSFKLEVRVKKAVTATTC